MSKTFSTHIDLPEDSRAAMIDLLNKNLAAAFDLHSQTKQAHWNVKGMQFIALHEMFDELAGAVLADVDMIAERITALGGEARGTVRMAAENSFLPELPEDYAGHDVVCALVERYAAVGAAAREGIDAADQAGDMATSDLFTEVARNIDKHLYFLEAHVQDA